MDALHRALSSAWPRVADGEPAVPPCAAADKLHLLASPLVRTGRQDAPPNDDDDAAAAEKQYDAASSLDADLPRFQTHHEPTLLEIFFDLFLAANFNAFVDTQRVTNHARFKAFIGYFCLLWSTWFLVTLFDVRYVTDSIFSRFTRALQLGVLVGFVVAPRFDPTNQQKGPMRTMSLILAVSRACLAIEYASTLWHLRRFRRPYRIAVSLQMAVHVVASVIYLGVAFRFHNDKRSLVYMAWYFVTAAECIGSILLSNLSPVLSLTNTHLMKRLTLLTVMIMGDGIIQLAKEVTVIVKHDNNWDPMTIGLVTAATATVYFLFLAYFDWMRGCYYLPALRQQLWTVLHLPFHLALVLHLQSLTQWLIWSKIFSLGRTITGILAITMDELTAGVTSLDIKDNMNSSIQFIIETYPPRIADTQNTINEALGNISALPNTLWPALVEAYRNSDFDLNNSSQENRDALGSYVAAASTISSSLQNALSSAFGIEYEDDLSKKGRAAHETLGSALQLQVSEKTWSLCRLVFAYGYVAASCTIFLMISMAIIARTVPFKAWHIVRFAIVFLLALGTGLTAMLWFNQDLSSGFLQGPWVMPPITFVWGVILVITHVNGPGVKRTLSRLRARQGGRKPPFPAS